MAPTFSFTLQLDHEGWEGMEAECVNEAAAIAASRTALQSRIDLRPLLGGPARSGAVGVGIGALSEAPDHVVWLGEWAWSSAEGWDWQSSD